MAIPIINVSILNGNNGFRLDKHNGLYDIGSVSSAGDFNGDGFDDVMVGASYFSRGSSPNGASFVVFGKASGFSAATDLELLDGNNGFRFQNFSSSLPYLVSEAGDVNGDGFDDVIIGAPGFYDYYGNPQIIEADSYVVFGRASGLDATMSLSGLDGTNGFRLDVGGMFVSVSSAGDVNGDGFDDVMVAANGNGPYYVVTSVVFGKASGFDAAMDLSSLDGSNGFRLEGKGAFRSGGREAFSSAGDINGDGFADVIANGIGVVFGKASGFEATLDLSNLDGSNGFRLRAEAVYDGLGSSVSSAGDVNGDGFGDLIVGAPGTDFNGDSSGSSYVVFGKASGFSAVMDLSGLDGNNGFRLDGVAAQDSSGSSVSNAGDVNGDGFDDLFVNGKHNSGTSYVVFGRASGFDTAFNLSSLDGNSGFRIVTDTSSRENLISGAGDVNGDGFDDLILGDRNASYVVFGGNFLNETVYIGTSGDDHLVGTILAERFDAGVGNDRMNGLGGADIFHGDAGDDNIAVPDLDFQLVDGGTGSDTLALTGGDINLNLADYHNIINGIETIDLSGDGNNTLILTLPDLLSLSDTTNIFTVNGNEGDRVTGLIDGWVQHGTEGNYRFYTNNGTILRVALDVYTDVPVIPGALSSLAELDGNNGFRLDGVAERDWFGNSVSTAGDVNGDGFDDLIIGAFGADPNDSASGSSYVVFGKASDFSAAMELSSLDGSNGFRLDGVAAEDRAGNSVSTAGDVNGDGIDDVIVGAYRADPNGTSSGSSYVVFGKVSGFSAAMELSSLDGSNGFRLDGEKFGHQSGFAVSNAGDVNGDGFDDLIIGAHRAGYGASGSSYVVFGKAAGFSAAMELSSLDGNNGFRLDGMEAYDYLGHSVSNGGDVNGDGFDDLIVGAFQADPNGYTSGSSYVVFGKASGFSARVSLSSLDGSNGFRLDGVGAGDRLGSSVSTAGDVNGDGFDDLVIGADRADPNGSASGSSYVVFGKASGFNATVNLSSLDGSNGFRMDGVESHSFSGSSVSTAGDVNDDGFDDLIVGAFQAAPNGNTSGSSYVVFGKASGFSAAMDLPSFASSFDNSSNGFRLNGVTEGDESGSSVSAAGDVNGDGFDDLIVGTPGADPNGAGSGSSYVIFGRSDFTKGETDFPGTPGDDIFTGTSAAESFEGGDGNDRMIGRGGADSFDGGAGNDYIRILGDDFQFVDGGLGTDILGLAGSGYNLDLSNVIDNIHGIETIALYGVGDNTVTLTAQDVIDLSQETNTLKIKGNAGDRVVGLSSGWTDGGVHGNFHTYTQGEAVLLIGVDVTTDFPIA
ncbi:FG-GAP repeat protein [Nitrosomonas ureae]|uniref:beta strand repeat-containing protein n=1 Tax=Nitrosomonas ureae TaxID=44577 RepID=UPI000D754217|nr:integrin alpha [Nitrosomonas ureae]PXX16590.1 FG-GAP repeat protein [Nitrosomonas ureae]